MSKHTISLRLARTKRPALTPATHHNQARTIRGKPHTTLEGVELFSTDFLQHYTDFACVTEMKQVASHCGFRFGAKEPSGETWDTFIATHTRFYSWLEMTTQAIREWRQRELGSDPSRPRVLPFHTTYPCSPTVSAEH